MLLQLHHDNYQFCSSSANVHHSDVLHRCHSELQQWGDQAGRGKYQYNIVVVVIIIIITLVLDKDLVIIIIIITIIVLFNILNLILSSSSCMSFSSSLP